MDYDVINSRGEDEDEPDTRDTAQLAAPIVETAAPIFDTPFLFWLTTENWKAFAYIFAPSIFILPQMFEVSTQFGMIGVLLCVGLFGLIIAVDQTTDPQTSVKDRLGEAVTSVRTSRSLPWDHDTALAHRLHGVEKFERSPDGNGITVMDDGRMVAHVTVDGCNTAKQKQSEADDLIQQLSTGIDEDIASFKWSYVSATDDRHPEELTDYWFNRANGTDNHPETDADTSLIPNAGRRTLRIAREYLEDLVDWFHTIDEPSWDSRRWEHSIAIEVWPDDAEIAAQQVMDTLGENTWRHRVQDAIPYLSPGPKSPQERADAENLVHEAMLSQIDNHVRTVERVLNSIDGVDAEGADTLEHARILLRYWSGQPARKPADSVLAQFEELPDDADSWNDDRILEAFRREGSSTNVHVKERPEQRWLAPEGSVENHDDDILIGSQLCRTYRIDSWNPTPDAHFLAELWEKNDVNQTLRIHAEPLEKEETITNLRKTLADLGVNLEDAQATGDWSKAGLEEDTKVLKLIHDHLRQTASEPWAVTGYVTVRVGPDDALDWMARTGREFDTLFPALRQALEEECEKVVKTLSGERAGVELTRPGGSTLELFESASPSGRNAHQLNTEGDKSTLMLGGALGAMFPFSTSYLDDPERGADSWWGRNVQNGTPILHSLTGGSGEGRHVFTFGQTRSGKTFFVQLACALWWLMKPWDRTLILCDTEGGFGTLVRLLGGEHIQLDGSTTINPFDIQPPKEGEHSIGSQFQMKQDEVREFFISLIREIGRDPSRYVPVIEEGIRMVYKNAGITKDPSTHSRESPPPSDFMDVLDHMIDNENEYTLSGNQKVIDDWSNIAAELLNILNQFKEGGKYDHMVGASSSGILDDDVRVAYIDLSNFGENNEAMKAVQLQLVFGQVYQKFKRIGGEKRFVIDEAHFLLHSSSMVDYLQDAARSWARYSAMLWFVTQSPREFIERAQGVEKGGENKRRTILDQCSVIQAFRTPKIQTDILTSLGMNMKQARFIKKKAEKGADGRFSECLISIQGERGWLHSEIAAHPFAELLFTHSEKDHGPLGDYLDYWWDWVRGEPIGAGPESEEEMGESDEDEIEPSPEVSVGNVSEGVRTDGGHDK